MSDSQEDITQTYLAAIEEELQHAMEQANDVGNIQLYDMLTYHMGWQEEPIKTIARGKRIRPLLVLLTCSAAGGNWKDALPAAAAVEMVHNFSLIHDDIEDQSALRRGRLTVWKKWGIAQAINAGDAMFTLAHLQPIRLSETVSQFAALKSVEVLQHACLHLTQGQYLDLAFEKRDDVSIDDYWSMVEGKTAALISASTELGAISAQCDDQSCVSYRNYGRLFGLAFQVQDDLLGIWGNSLITGKSNQSDLITGKKTLPILYGLSQTGKFAERWHQGPFHQNEIDELMNLLEDEGGKAFALSKAVELINNALIALDEAHPVGYAGLILKELAINLVHRQS
jgi:geranylgeranyl diphosphate synthase type I